MEYANREVTEKDKRQHEKWRCNYDAMEQLIHNHADYQLKPVVSCEEDLEEIDYIQDILDIPNVYSSNGDSFYEHTIGKNKVTEQEINLDQFPTPDELWSKFKEYKNINDNHEEKIISLIKEKAKANKKEVSKEEAEKILKESQEVETSSSAKEEKPKASSEKKAPAKKASAKKTPAKKAPAKTTKAKPKTKKVSKK